MRASFEVSAASGSYTVAVGSDLVRDALSDHSAAIVMIDSRLLNRLPQGFQRVIAIDATEANKSLERLSPVIAKMRELGAHRKSHLVAIGGGIIQDIATFCASVYMRGITWDYLPTTLLGMVDSCIGGKSSINVSGYKNLVGNFYPPKRIVIDIGFVGSLSGEQQIAGLCEAAKICYARGAEEFSAYLADGPAVHMDGATASKVILRSLQTKRWFIETDEFDQNERLLLNFGHTFGHALESATDFGIPHGIAVGIGMIVATDYARSENLLNDEGLGRCAGLVAHINGLLSNAAPSYQVIDSVNIDLILKKFDSDKKHTGENYRVILPTKNGALEIVTIPKSEASLARFAGAYHGGFADVARVGSK